MTSVRVLHRGITYRLLNFKQASDWSLVISWDRRPQVDPQYHRFSSASPIPVAGIPSTDQKRLTYHPTGQVNYHGWVETPSQFHQPLHAITQPQLVIGISIVAATSLTLLESKVKCEDIVVNLADDVGDTRFTIGLVIAPYNSKIPPNTIFSLKYDIFLIFCVTLPPPHIPNELDQHNIYFAPEGSLPSRAIKDPNVAMLSYHQARVGHAELGIYPPNGDGVYHLLPSVVMRAVPQVKITFTEPEYRIEIEHQRARPMLIPFRIFRGQQRITKADLRSLITSIELDAEL